MCPCVFSWMPPAHGVGQILKGNSDLLPVPKYDYGILMEDPELTKPRAAQPRVGGASTCQWPHRLGSGRRALLHARGRRLAKTKQKPQKPLLI